LELQERDLAQAAQVSRGLAVLGGQERLQELKATLGPTVRPPRQMMFM